MTRVAYFPDSFHEVNGVAHTSRHFQDFGRRRGLPFLCVRAGDRPERIATDGSLTTLELPRGVLSIPLDKDLKLDPAWMRHIPILIRTVRAFRPDVIHITGPSELGILGALLAYYLRVPLAASWHTNVHEYAATRSHWLFDGLGEASTAAGARFIQTMALGIAAWFYSRADVLFAPNTDLCQLLERKTKRPCHLMQRGIDADVFCPNRRDRDASDAGVVLGFVGRLSVEKNIALLARVQKELEDRGLRNFRFRIVGQGVEEAWLRQHLPRAEFTGVLRGEPLARAYAGMDVFVFPSHTDTFGNVVLEALASGVPAVVTPDGGPRSLIEDGRTGLIATDAEFASAIERILSDPAQHAKMRVEARQYALSASWDAVFEGVYSAYQPVLRAAAAAPPMWRKPRVMREE
ncbi:MAG TPA: glycosyltransferase [Acidobacteriaceae bacterium]|nr:glycosyltransferase [Acidobacteriaceae bacterium]